MSKDPRQVCADAAEIIQRDGWHQGDYYEVVLAPRAVITDDGGNRTAPVCALGAINRAATGRAWSPWVWQNEDVKAAMLLVEKSLGLSEDGGSISEWNDAPERTREDVILAFKQAAAG